MAVTPFIKPLQITGGTFYSFISPSKDVTETIFSDSEKRFNFSKFVLLNIPDIKRPSELNPPTINSTENYIQFDTIEGAALHGLSTDVNVNLAESFQNYVLNMEVLNVNRDDYDTSNYRTSSEAIFFNG